MCKILVITKVTKETQEAAKVFAETMTPIMAEKDQDGIGYAALGTKGVFGERWLEPNDAWQSAAKEGVLSDYATILKGGGNAYNKFGVKTEDITCLMVHARMATCEFTLKNVHPFVKEDTALIHNGVIGNHAEFPKTLSTCDSEALLTQYLDHDAINHPKYIEDALDQLTGWYAAAVIAKDKQGKWYLDIFKDSKASLHCAYIAELDSVVFCTRPEMLEQACDELEWARPMIAEVKNNSYVRIDAVTGKPVFTRRLDLHPKVSKLSTSKGYSGMYPYNNDEQYYSSEYYTASGDDVPVDPLEEEDSEIQPMDVLDMINKRSNPN